MGWYPAPNVLPQALQAELMELSKSGDAQMNAILETVGDLDGYEEVEAIELITSICDEFVVAAKHLKTQVLKYKPAEQIGFPGYKLTDNQKLFVAEAEEAGLEINYDYSSSLTDGKRCPAVCARVLSTLTPIFTAKTGVEVHGLGVTMFGKE